jgi:hypothetical protein
VQCIAPNLHRIFLSSDSVQIRRKYGAIMLLVAVWEIRLGKVIARHYGAQEQANRGASGSDEDYSGSSTESDSDDDDHDSSSHKARKRKSSKERGRKDKPQRKEPETKIKVEEETISLKQAQYMLKEQRDYADTQREKERKNMADYTKMFLEAQKVLVESGATVRSPAPTVNVTQAQPSPTVPTWDSEAIIKLVQATAHKV